MKRTAVWLSAAAVVGLSVAVTGCTSARFGWTSGANGAPTKSRADGYPRTIALNWRHGWMPGFAPPRSGARLLSPTRLAFVTFGSGSCPELPTTLAVLGKATIRLTLAVYAGRDTPCTADDTATTVEVAIDPRRVDVHRDLRIWLDYGHHGRVALEAAGLGRQRTTS